MAKNEKTGADCTRDFFLGAKNWKIRHILRKKFHMSPYLDHEFFLLARTSQNGRKIHFTV
jgi:hypothetical protein